MALTVMAIRKLKNKEGKPYTDYLDGNGLKVRVAKTGAKSFIYRYKMNNKAYEYTIGSCEEVTLTDARQEHAKLRALVKSGTNPKITRDLQLKEQNAVPTVAAFANTFIEKYSKRKQLKSWKEQQRILNVDVIPFIGDLKIDEVSKRHIHKLLERKLDNGSVVAHNRLLSLLSKLFNYALSIGEIESNNPASKIEKYKEQKRDRVLTNDEIRMLWDHTGENSSLDISTRLTIRLRLLTGQRTNEITSIKVKHLIDGVWYMPQTKNGLPHALPITKLMQSIIDEALPHAKNGLLLPARNGGVMRSQVISRIFERIDWQLEDGQQRPTAHDLRRTFRTGLGKLKYDNFIQRKLTNHKSNSQYENEIDRTYNGYEYMDEKRQALEAWQRELVAVLGLASPSNVIQLKTA